MTRVSIIDYGYGNIKSVARAFEEVGAAVQLIQTADEILAAQYIVLPGQGAFPTCKQGLDHLIPALNQAVLGQKTPMLGICVGMQLMVAEGHEYQRTDGLGWFAGATKLINLPANSPLKLPNMGWNRVYAARPHPIMHDIKDGAYFYFAHSYAVFDVPTVYNIAMTEHGVTYPVVIAKDNIIGIQFHPEKSQTAGLRILKNFIEWNPNG